MATPKPAGDDLVPLSDRVRWMLTYRAAVVAFLPVAALLGIGPGPVFGRPFLVGAGWLALTMVTLPALRLGRGVALSVFSASLLGDGLLVGALRPVLGWLGGPVELIMVGHVVAVTLLASFRTGVKIMLWHLLVCYLVLESRAVGLFGPATGIPLGSFTVTMGLAWLIMAATASFAAVNERELRRRRYDTERLHAFGAEIAHALEALDVIELLAAFAREELLARRGAVLLYPEATAAGRGDRPAAYVWGSAGMRVEAVATGTTPPTVLHQALESNRSVLSNRLTPDDDPVLAHLLPGAHALMVVPFSTGEVRGALVVEHARRSSQRGSRRVELRVLDTAEQAAAQASVAIGRALLLAQTRGAAQTDGLTGLANRRAFDDRLATEIALAATGGRPVTLIMIDLDHFKSLNDSYGHQVGDEVLRTVAGVLQANSPAGSVPARYGGEELAVILPGTDLYAGVAVAERIRTAIEAAPTPAPVTASLGLASCPGSGYDQRGLLAAADAALYEAKHRGRNQVVSARQEVPTA
jgi:two-component system, cell cycle response regulator